jgi:hypothetical protein
MTPQPSAATRAWHEIPEHLRGGLARHLVHGIRTGGFLEAVLENDLARAVAYGDDKALAGIKPLIVFLENYAPRGAWGPHGSQFNWRALGPSTRVATVREHASDAWAVILDDSGIPLDVEAA